MVIVWLIIYSYLSNKHKEEKKVIRLIIGVILGILVVVFALQNTETVTYNFIAWSLTAPRAVVVLLVLLAGIIIGWVTTGIRRMGRKK